MNVDQDRTAALFHMATQGRLSRRHVLKRAMALGLTAPVIASLLAACGADDEDATPTPAAANPSPTVESQAGEPTATAAESDAQASPTVQDAAEEPTATAAADPTATTEADSGSSSRGAVDRFRMLNWQAPTILNSHLASGGKDHNPAVLVLEPLVDFAPDGTVVARLVTEVPTIENGGLAADGTSVTYKLRDDVVWSDGEPFTAEDVRFTWEYITDPATSATSQGVYRVVEDVQVVDAHTVTITFVRPNPGWFIPFGGGYYGTVLPKHILEEYKGERAREAPFNLAPVGTGPYKVVDFRPGDVIFYELNELYRDPEKPHFQEIEWKGGGDAASAARAVVQTGEADWGWGLQIDKQLLENLSANASSGMFINEQFVDHERVKLNFANPREEVDGAYAEPTTQHPFIADFQVRQAFALAMDRDTIAAELYGIAATPTANILNMPPKFTSPNTSYEFDLERAAELLDEAGWELDGNWRKKDGQEMSVVYQTTINELRQRTQEVIKAAFEQIGVPVEIKAIDSSIFFSADPGNDDTAAKFYADFEMYSTGPLNLFPIDYMALYKSNDPESDLSQKANDWTGPNRNRWVSEEYNALYEQLENELDPDGQAELFIAMNDLVVNDIVDIVLVHRDMVIGVNTRLRGNQLSPWTPGTWDIANWYYED